MSAGAGETKVEASGSEKEGIPGADYSKRGQS
jgi:hypothetical protein